MQKIGMWREKQTFPQHFHNVEDSQSDMLLFSFYKWHKGDRK